MVCFVLEFKPGCGPHYANTVWKCFYLAVILEMYFCWMKSSGLAFLFCWHGLSSFFPMCIYVSLHVGMGIVHVCTCLWRPEVDVGTLSWFLFHLILGGRISESNPELAETLLQLAGLILCSNTLPLSSEAGTSGRPSHPFSIYVGPGDPNSGLLACMVNALTSEPFHQPLSPSTFSVYSPSSDSSSLWLKTTQCHLNYGSL